MNQPFQGSGVLNSPKKSSSRPEARIQELETERLGAHNGELLLVGPPNTKQATWAVDIGGTDLDEFVLTKGLGRWFPNFMCGVFFGLKRWHWKKHQLEHATTMLIWVIVSFHVSNKFAVFQLWETGPWPVFVVTSQVFQKSTKVGYYRELQKWADGDRWSQMQKWSSFTKPHFPKEGVSCQCIHHYNLTKHVFIIEYLVKSRYCRMGGKELAQYGTRIHSIHGTLPVLNIWYNQCLSPWLSKRVNNTELMQNLTSHVGGIKSNWKILVKSDHSPK